MEILDPDLWNDDGTPKKPSQEYMQRLDEAQQGEVFLNFARIKREAKAARGPEVGDIVHFWDDESACCRAAIVLETESFNHNAELRVHIPREPYADAYAVHDENKNGAGEGTWHWPCSEGQ